VRVLLISDTHGALDPRVLAQARECDLVVHAGDIGAAGVLDQLAAAAPRVVAIRGNNDVAAKWPRTDAARLESLPVFADIALPGGLLVAVHGDRLPAPTRHSRLRRLHPHARAVVCGHSHRLAIDCSGQPWVLNPGAAGRVRTFGGPSALWLDADAGRWAVTAWRADGPQGGPVPRRGAGA
jgi:uncharacterized protein